MPISISGKEIIINYSNRDYNSLRNDFIELAQELFPSWNDLSAYDPGIVLAEYQARIGSGINFYVDRRAEENYPSTCRLMTSLERIGKAFNFIPSYASTSTVDISFTVNNSGTIPKYFRIGTESTSDTPATSYELLSDYSAPSAGTYIITCSHGITYENETLGSSTGKPSQRFTIVRLPVAVTNGLPYVLVDVNEGGIWYSWTYVNDFFDSLPTDRHYKLERLETGEFVVVFGDNIKGKIPPQGIGNIRVTYRIGGGISGNRPGVGTITKILDAKGSTIVTSVTNLTRPSGGSDSQTLEEAKELFPQVISSNDRVVTYADASAELEDASIGVHKAKAYRGNGPYEFCVVIAAEGSNPVPTGYWDPYLEVGEGLIGAAGAYLNERLSGSYVLTIKPAIAVPTISNINVWVQNRAYKNSVRDRLTTALSTFFSSSTYTFGETVYLDELAQTIENVDGVDYSEIEELHRSPRARFLSGLDNALFTNYAVSSLILDEYWTIQFTGTNTFKVIGSVSGEQINTGIADGSIYYNDNNSLKFSCNLITGKVCNQFTKYQIRTSEYKGSIPTDSDEIITEGTTTITLYGGIG